MYELTTFAIYLVPALILGGLLPFLLPPASPRWKFGCLLFVCYLMVAFAFVGLPSVTYIRPDFTVQLVPFSEFENTWLFDCLNVLLFLPLGVFLPLLWPRLRSLKKATLWGFCSSLTVEVLQLFTYRATDVDDLIFNTLGAVAGYLLLRPFFRKLSTKPRPNWEPFAVMGAALLVQLTVDPILTDFLFSLIRPAL